MSGGSGDKEIWDGYSSKPMPFLSFTAFPFSLSDMKDIKLSLL